MVSDCLVEFCQDHKFGIDIAKLTLSIDLGLTALIVVKIILKNKNKHNNEESIELVVNLT